MKLRSYFFGALACLALASCSSDDDAVAEGEGYDPNRTHYVAINIVNPTETRATGGDFEIGSDRENSITKATLLFYDVSGNFVTSVSNGHPGQTGGNLNEWKTDGGGDPETEANVERITRAVCVLKGLGAEMPASVIAVLNTTLPTEYTETGSTKKLSDLKTLIGQYSSDSSGDFVMSNSVYGSSANCEVELTSDNIQTAEAQALLNPVVIHVERLLARVDLRQAKDVGLTINNSTEKVGIAQTETVITPVITGYGLAAKNPDSYLLKNLGNKYWDWDEWDDTPKYRSYWAVSARPSTFEYDSWSTISATDDNLPAFDAVGGPRHLYCLENTNNGSNEKGYAYSAGKAPQEATTLVVAAQLQVGGTPIDLVKYAGSFYRKTDFFEVVENYLNSKGLKYKNGGADATDWRNVLELTQTGTPGNQAYKVKPTIVTGTTFESDVVKDAVTSALNTLGEAWYWNQGKAYYFVTIEHFGTPDCLYGVVRNHIYDITIQSVTGLGTPVADPDEDIVPEKPVGDEESHVAAQIKVLKWKIVKQHNVELN